MTETEWLASDDPQGMLHFLATSFHQLSARKLRLFAVYCCRNILHPETESEVMRAVELGELYAEGLASEDEFRSTSGPVHRVWLEYFGSDRVSTAVWCLTDEAIQNPFRAAITVSLNAIDAARLRAGTGSAKSEAELQAAWVRDLFPSPYRPKHISRGWFSSADGVAHKLATAIYAERAFDRMPILADALEEAGCDQPDMLYHCRGPGPHARGCWVVDAVLGKQ